MHPEMQDLAGAVSPILSPSTMDESYPAIHAGKLAGIATVLGFALAVSIVILERAGPG